VDFDTLQSQAIADLSKELGTLASRFGQDHLNLRSSDL
jgi:hypothetical protein